MGFVIALLVLVFVVVPIAAAWMGFGLHVLGKKQRATALGSRSEILAKTFGEGLETVTYDSRAMASLEATSVIDGAVRSGYELISNDGGVLLFKKPPAPWSPVSQSSLTT